MPEPLVHFIIPLILLVMFGFSIKKATFISSLAVLPDLDVLFHIHRSISHSIFFILMVSFPAILITKKYYKDKFNESIISALVILSHPFMDMFTDFTPVFWPLFNKSIHIVSELTTNMNDVLDLNLTLQVYFKPIAFYRTTNIDAPIFSSAGVGVSLVLLIGLILKHHSIKKASSRP
jgi:membrane-bound metal-dependent hydrolase YbcI (DUF457 family)